MTRGAAVEPPLAVSSAHLQFDPSQRRISPCRGLAFPPGGPLHQQGETMRIKFLGVLSVCVLAVVVLALPASGLGTQESTSMYIVQLVQAPVAGYAGGVDGYAATKPGKGKKVDVSSVGAQKYAGYLRSAHDNALRKVGGGDKVYDYTTVFNGFAAPLTDGQAEKLRGADGVLTVEK